MLSFVYSTFSTSFQKVWIDMKEKLSNNTCALPSRRVAAPRDSQGRTGLTELETEPPNWVTLFFILYLFSNSRCLKGLKSADVKIFHHPWSSDQVGS